MMTTKINTNCQHYSKNVVPDTNAPLLGPRFICIPSLGDRLSPGGLCFERAQMHWTKIERHRMECGWNANGTRTQKERVRVRKDIFTV